MDVELIKEYRFEAAHRLPNVRAGHKCARLHGHSFRFELSLVGVVDPVSGWFLDFGDIDDLVGPVLAQLDHHDLNEIDGLHNPTSENVSRWIFEQLKPHLPALRAVTLWETADARCVYRG